RIAVGEGVEARTEENILRDALGDGPGERVFRVAAARDEERAKGDGERAVRTGGSTAKLFVKGGTEDRNGDGVVEDERPCVVKLVRSAAQGYAEGGSRWVGVLHEERRFA